MNKILLIIQREYLSRVKKKSFIVMTLLTPLLIACFYGMMFYFSLQGIKGTHNHVAVVSEQKILTEQLPSTENITYTYVDKSLPEMKKEVNKGNFD